MPELFDVVDRDDNVIGQATYAEARAEKKIIRVVQNWVFNDEGSILLQFRKMNKISYPRCFDAAVGGKVDAGETYDQAVRRESREELGISVEPKYAGKYFVDIPHEYKFVSLYYTYHEGPFTNWEEEAEALTWMHWDELYSMYDRYPFLFIDHMGELISIIKTALKRDGKL